MSAGTRHRKNVPNLASAVVKRCAFCPMIKPSRPVRGAHGYDAITLRGEELLSKSETERKRGLSEI